MGRKLILTAMVLVAIAVAIATSVLLDRMDAPTGNVVMPIEDQDFVEIDRDDLKMCCELESGEGCYVLENKDCDHCLSYCG